MPIEDDFIPTTCERCFSYSHPYLDRCLSCGATLSSLLPHSMADIEADERLASTPRTINNLVAMAGPDDQTYLQASLGFVKMGVMDEAKLLEASWPKPVRQSRLHSRRRAARGHLFAGLLAPFSGLKLRYLGDLPYVGGAADCEWALSKDTLVVYDSHNRRALANVPAASIVLTTGVGVSEALFNGTLFHGYGTAYSTGNLTAYTWVNPRMQTGQLQVAFVAGGALYGLRLGSRTGLFAPRATAETYMMFAMQLGSWASQWALVRDAEIGPNAYLSELGLA